LRPCRSRDVSHFVIHQRRSTHVSNAQLRRRALAKPHYSTSTFSGILTTDISSRGMIEKLACILLFAQRGLKEVRGCQMELLREVSSRLPYARRHRKLGRDHASALQAEPMRVGAGPHASDVR
jgi:hypothetical protein